MIEELKVKSFSFPGGELQVEFSMPADMGVGVFHRVQSSDELLVLLLLTEIIDRENRQKKLTIPYFPYARQDRVTQRHVAFSLKVVARLINDLKYNEVISYDVHSDVTPALVNNMRVIKQVDIITKGFPKLDNFIRNNITAIIAPDAGAAKKAAETAKFYGLPLLQASKVRDVTTGEITGTKIYDDLMGHKCLIVDDICDGGRTFIKLAKALRESGAREVHLYVTHGIFSKGYNVFDGLLDSIYTTDTFLPATKPSQDDLPVVIQELNYTGEY